MASENTIGVAVVRFQVAKLHEGHRSLVDRIRQRHQSVLIVLGSTGGSPTPEDPLPYQIRADMVLETYDSGITVAEIRDHPIGPRYWSRDLDAIIEKTYPGRDAILYGSRSSFLDLYSGKHSIQMLKSVPSISGTALRANTLMPMTEEGRTALIWQANNRFPITYRAADIAILRASDNFILLIGKDEHEGFLSFPGGHVDPGESDEDAAVRERAEEVTDITVGPFTYLGSFPVDDPRYRGSKDGMTTTLFSTWWRDGTPVAGDDAKRVEWVAPDNLLKRLVPWHRPLGEKLLAHLEPL